MMFSVTAPDCAYGFLNAEDTPEIQVREFYSLAGIQLLKLKHLLAKGVDQDAMEAFVRWPGSPTALVKAQAPLLGLPRQIVQQG